MEITILVKCPKCGDVRLKAREVRLVVSSVAERSFYEFTCNKRCRARIHGPARSEVIALLTHSGVIPEYVQETKPQKGGAAPAEVTERQAQRKFRKLHPVDTGTVEIFRCALNRAGDYLAVIAEDEGRR